MNYDMTKGNERKILFRFCIPLFFSCVCQQLYSVVDGVVVGRFISSDPVISENSLAAVGVSAPVTMLFMAVAIGASIGVSVLLSQLFGAGKYERLKTATSTALITIFVLGILFTALGRIFSNPILDLLNTPASIYKDASAYLDIFIYGIIFLLLYNICSGVFTSLGNSKTPLYLLFGSSVLNIVLDLVFVICFGFGVQGVAWATFLSQGLSAAVAFYLMYAVLKKLKTNEKFVIFSFQVLWDLCRLAIPSILQQAFVAVGNLFVQRIINVYDPASIAGFFSALKLNSFAVSSYMSVANGISSFTAQNYGANKIKRVLSGIKSGAIILAFLSVPIAILTFVFAPQLINIFLSQESVEAVAVGSQFLRYVSPFYPIIVIKVLFDSIFRGIGKMNYFMMSTLADLILRVMLSYVMSSYFGLLGISYAWIIGWLVAAALATTFFFNIKSKYLCIKE
ncbi:MAG: MATE family efflux transporter [Clostridia bacterium]